MYAVTKRKQARLKPRSLELFDLANSLEAGAPSLFETSQLVAIVNVDQDVCHDKGTKVGAKHDSFEPRENIHTKLDQ